MRRDQTEIRLVGVREVGYVTCGREKEEVTEK